MPFRTGTTGSPPPVAPDGARTSSSSLSSSLDGAAPGSGAGVLASCSCSTRLRRARMRWCRAAYSWPVSLELAWWGRAGGGSAGYKASGGDYPWGSPQPGNHRPTLPQPRVRPLEGLPEPVAWPALCDSGILASHVGHSPPGGFPALSLARALRAVLSAPPQRGTHPSSPVVTDCT